MALYVLVQRGERLLLEIIDALSSVLTSRINQIPPSWLKLWPLQINCGLEHQNVCTCLLQSLDWSGNYLTATKQVVHSNGMPMIGCSVVSLALILAVFAISTDLKPLL